MEQSPSWESNRFAASQEIPHIFGTRRFLTVFTSARHMSLSWANSIQSPQPPPTSWSCVLILSSHLRLGLPNGLLPSGFPTRNLLHKELQLWNEIKVILVSFFCSSSVHRLRNSTEITSSCSQARRHIGGLCFSGDTGGFVFLIIVQNRFSYFLSVTINLKVMVVTFTLLR